MISTKVGKYKIPKKIFIYFFFIFINSWPAKKCTPHTKKKFGNTQKNYEKKNVKIYFLPIFSHSSILFWYRCFYPHRSRSSVSLDLGTPLIDVLHFHGQKDESVSSHKARQGTPFVFSVKCVVWWF